MQFHSKIQIPVLLFRRGSFWSIFNLIIAILILATRPASLGAEELPSEEDVPPIQIDLCEACRLVVSSFEKGMEKTARGKHEGGDTSWEEKNLKSYQDSEVRLIEIQEKLCDEVKIGDGKAKCLSVAEDSESYVEEWWFKHRNKNVRLHDYLCISKTKHCCPKNAYGPKCQPCPPSDCSSHGHCDGSGTRSGTGECKCDEGYSGRYCEECSGNHYRIETTDGFNCRKCDSVCKDCYGPGPLNCTTCRDGYHKEGTDACVDIDECKPGYRIPSAISENERVCEGNKYCVNTEGSYRCSECHHACDGCVAYGLEVCLACSAGYQFDADRICRQVDEDGNFQDDYSADDEDSLLFEFMILLFGGAIVFAARRNRNDITVRVGGYAFLGYYFLDRLPQLVLRFMRLL